MQAKAIKCRATLFHTGPLDNVSKRLKEHFGKAGKGLRTVESGYACMNLSIQLRKHYERLRKEAHAGHGLIQVRLLRPIVEDGLRGLCMFFFCAYLFESGIPCALKNVFLLASPTVQ